MESSKIATGTCSEVREVRLGVFTYIFDGWSVEIKSSE